MADLNPINAWRRMLALPNESRTKTVVIAFLVSGICALMVSGATVLLRPIQTMNRAAEQQARLESLVAGIPGMSALLQQSGGRLGTVVVDLARGAAAADVTPETLPAALDDSANWTGLEQSADLAGLGNRPNYVQIYLLRNDSGDVSLAILPIKVADASGDIRFAVARGASGNEYEVDGITGATRTSNAITRMVRFWLGPDGYGPLISAIQRGEY